MFSLNTFFKICIYCTLEFLLFITVIYAGICSDANKNKIGGKKYYGWDDPGCPKQLFQTYTNLGYSFVGGISFGLVKWDYFRIYIPMISMGILATFLSLGSMYYHGTNNYGNSGTWDVALIPPFIVSFVWFTLWTFFASVKWYLRFFPLINFRSDFHDPNPLPICSHIPIFALELLLFLTIFNSWVVPSWKTMFEVFQWSILSIVGTSVFIKLYFVIRKKLAKFDPKTAQYIKVNWKYHGTVLFTSFFLVCLTAFLGNIAYPNYEHGTNRHLVISGLVMLSVVYDATMLRIIVNYKDHKDHKDHKDYLEPDDKPIENNYVESP